MTTPTISIERLVTDGRALFLESPCILRTEKGGGVERHFDRSSPNAESILREIFEIHCGPHSNDVLHWVRWCMDTEMPRITDTRLNKRRDGDQFFDWLGVG